MISVVKDLTEIIGQMILYRKVSVVSDYLLNMTSNVLVPGV